MCSERALAAAGRTLVAIGLMLWSVASLADDRAVGPPDDPVGDRDRAPMRFEARPATCVALHRGQDCFKRVRLSWTALGEGRFCVLLDGATAPLTCWRGDARGDWSHDYASAEAERYRLVSTDADGAPLDTLATATVNTSWVYRGSRRGSGGWRLF